MENTPTGHADDLLTKMTQNREVPTFLSAAGFYPKHYRIFDLPAKAPPSQVNMIKYLLDVTKTIGVHDQMIQEHRFLSINEDNAKRRGGGAWGGEHWGIGGRGV